MKRETRGRKRKFNPKIPAHIDQNKIPSGCYWENKGAGSWYANYKDHTGRARRKWIAGPNSLMSDLHRLVEEFNGIDRDTFGWIAGKYFDSQSFAELAKKSKATHKNSYNTIHTYITRIRLPLSEIPLKKWDDSLVQQFIDKMGKVRGPTAARLVNSFIRRVFQWSKKRGYCKYNPAKQTELPKERKKQIYPRHDTYYALLSHARKMGTFKAKFKGSCPHYMWMIMELEYLCRQRGVECRTLTDAHINKDGVLTERVKKSRDNITLWNDRLRLVVLEAQKAREEIVSRRKFAIPLKPEDRFLIVNTLGENLKESAYHSAWQRFITNSIKTNVIAIEDRFSLHDLKRKGITDTEGTRSEKLDASGHVDARMLKIYDKSIPKVKPTSE